MFDWCMETRVYNMMQEADGKVPADLWTLLEDIYMRLIYTDRGPEPLDIDCETVMNLVRRQLDRV